MRKIYYTWGLYLCFALCASAQSAYDYYDIGLEAMSLEQYDEARDAFDQAISLSPENDDYYLARAELSLVENRHTFNKVNSDNNKFYRQALSDFEKALELAPNSFEGLYGRARLKYMFLNFKESQTDYDGALKAAYLNEDKVLALGGRGACQYRLGEVDGAMRDLERALTYDPFNSVILNELALIYINQEETGLAIDVLNTVLKHHPEDPIALANMGYTALKAGKYKKALSIYNQVLLETDANGFLLSNRAFCHLQLEQYEEALESINASLEVNPKNSFAFKNRALIHLALEKKDAACEDLHRAKQLGFTLAYGNEVIQLLKENCLNMNRAPGQ